MTKMHKILISSSLLILSTLSLAANNISKEAEAQAVKATNLLSDSIQTIVEQQTKYMTIRKSFIAKHENEIKDIQAKIDSLPSNHNKKETFKLELQKWNKTLPLKYQEIEIIKTKLASGEFTEPVLLMMILKDVSLTTFIIKAYDYDDEYKIPNDLVFKYSEILALTKDKFINSMKKQKQFRDNYNKTISKATVDLKKYTLTATNDQKLIDMMTREFVISNLKMVNPMYTHYVGRIVPEVLLNKQENSAKSTKNYNLHQCIALYNILGPDWDCPHKSEAEHYMETNTIGYKSLFKEYYE